MTAEVLRDLLLWSALVNYGVLLWWFLIFALAHDWMFRFHGRWFALSRSQFDAIHYGSMAGYKLGIFLLNLVPGLVLFVMR
ncbi:hypothetical protein M0534_01535 [Methylonatrum kenyense]|uniref:DUF6868 family protein n=1 Tax=Methylonatrum kenyense TaxID=455253 RepID=UPI0020C0BB62|nr:hypothetical protein [Methylonatrum kenyense]MCK8515013.1 hypothetical protein [Methylonatrum kenyense]